MKKLLACLLISAMTLTALTACNSSQSADSDSSDTSLNATDEQSTENKNNTSPTVIAGKDGADGKDGKDGEKGDKGDKGAQGAQGSTGKKGADGRSIISVQIIDGNLWITYSDDPKNPVNAGIVSEALANPAGLGFYLLPDNTYAVNAGNAIFLDEIVIPESYNGKPVSSLLSEAFKNCSNLKKITIPNSVQTIGENAFTDCTNIESMTVPFVGASKDGTGATNLGYFFGITVDEHKESIPKKLKSIAVTGETAIGEKAFYDCSNLASISLSDGITSIGENAFYGTKYYVTDTNWENGVLYIGNHIITAKNAVAGTYTVKSGTKTIADNAFYNCDLLTAVKLPEGLIGIGKNAFSDCEKLSSINLPASLSKIGDLAFFGCKNLSLSINEKNQSYKIIDGSLYTADEKTLVLYGIQNTSDSFTIPTTVKTIGAGAFAYCQNLTSVSMPNNLETIEKSAFYSCSITEIVIPNKVKSIGDNAFYNASKLEKLTIGNSVTDIGESAFENCSKIKILIIPNSTKNIGAKAFNNCTSLLSVTVGKNVESIGEEAFNLCYKIAEVINLSTKIAIDKSDNNPGTIASSAFEVHSDESRIINNNGYLFYNVEDHSYLIDYDGKDAHLILPDDINGNSYSIAKYAFYNCDKIASVVISDGVTSVSRYAFYGCYNLSSVTLGKNISQIAQHAFENCYKLVEVINKSSIEMNSGEESNGYVARYALEIEIHDGASKLTDDDGYLFYSFEGKNYLLGYSGYKKDLDLPESYKGEGYVIYKYAFYCNESIVGITIPDGATSISEYSFYSCYNLKNVSIGSGVTSIGDYAFMDCAALTAVNMGNNVESIGKSAFRFCSSLASIKISAMTTSIASYAFSDCPNLCSVTFSNTEGWCYYLESDVTNKNTLSSDDLSLSSTAAQYLTLKHFSKNWIRTI